jgi:UDP-N-acetylmuramate dehydrogenase
MEKLKNLNINYVTLLLNCNLQKYTTIKLADFGDIALCKSEQGLVELVKYLQLESLNYHLIGWGANQVVHNTKNTIFIKLEFFFDKNSITPGKLKFNLPASTSLNQLTSLAVKYGFSGWEVFTGIPGSLGGAICMNAGTSLGEICEIVESVRILRANLSIEEFKVQKSSFRYRNNNFIRPGDVILSATVFYYKIDSELGKKINSYLEYRKNTQPLTTRNCGSVFKNHGDFKAGIIIDRIGLKGFGTENITVSKKHGNFIENNGNGNSAEFIDVIKRLKEQIERFSGHKFELEVKVY